ncbi:MAG: hypothetical protein ACRD0B_04515 [Acidimicrobiales bacterium]
MTDELVEADARFLEGVVIDNERCNALGIEEKDIVVVFEMDARCGWGDTFSVRRFKRALKAMRSEAVVRVGDRWFARMATSAGRAMDAGPRRCDGPRCKKDIGPLRGDAKYCSTACQVAASRARKRHGAVWVSSETSRSEGAENAAFSTSGTDDQPPRKTVRNPYTPEGSQ